MIKTMKILLPMLLMLTISSSFATAEMVGAHCRSQLVRVSVSDKAFTGVSAKTVLSILQDVAPSIQPLLERDFEITEIDFPQFQDVCQRKKNDGDPLYRNVDCAKEGLCNDPTLHPDVKSRVCFYLPCPIFEGTLEVGRCQKVETLYPTKIGFPAPIEINKIELTPTTTDYQGNEATMCFDLRALEIRMAASLTFQTTGTSLSSNKINIGNITGTLDQPREICIKSNINLVSHNILQNVRIIPQGSAPFISDKMLNDVADQMSLSGLSGYRAKDIQAIKRDIIPPILHPLRESIESGVHEALSEVISEQVKIGLLSIDTTQPGTPQFFDSTAFASELNYIPKNARDSLAFYECYQTALIGKKIPQNHPCIGLLVRPKWKSGEPIPDSVPLPMTADANFFLGSETFEYQYIESYKTYDNISSETFRKRLVALKKNFQSEYIDPALLALSTKEKIKANWQYYIKAVLDPFIAQIEAVQKAEPSFNMIEIQGEVTPGARRNVGLSMPSLCSMTKPSAHANISIPNCPVQVFVDMHEFNKALVKLWESGRICSSGKGETCGLPGGEGLWCKMSNAPQLRYNAGRYSTSLKLKNCRKDLLPFGIFGAKLGADFNVSMNFKPKACHNGDFCIDDPRISWAIVNGTETGMLKDDPFIRSKVTQTINKAVESAMSLSFRIPLASATEGIISKVPLRSEGRIKSGPGYFGACLEQDRK